MIAGRRFQDKVALVTGGASGIGAATARALGREGAAVVVSDLDGAGAEVVASEIAASGGRAVAATCDVAAAADVEHAVAVAADRYGGLHAVAACAGIARHGRAPDVSEADWEAVVGTNLKGTFLTAKYAIPLIATSGGGAVVTVSSVNAVATARTIPAYAASKGGIVALSRSLAVDHAGDGVRVNCILPGSVDTAMLRASAERRFPDDPDAALRAWGQRHPIGHILTPDSVASIVVFLLSEQSAAMTGAAVAVDGGLSALLAL
jgi:NAD(P)-dependent dehydrogenase (short-subunit alcohol dehydrogenase family)